MRVLLLRGQPSARARVQAHAIRFAHPEIELALARQGGRGGEGLEREWALGDRPARGLREAIAAFSPDLIHCHTPPDFLTVCANELTAGRIPVIHDVDAHDDDREIERRAVEESDALIVSSPALLEELGDPYALPRLTVVFANYPLARELSQDGARESAETHIGRIASLYETLVREPMAGIVPGR